MSDHRGTPSLAGALREIQQILDKKVAGLAVRRRRF
jgi:hypothetical protein